LGSTDFFVSVIIPVYNGDKFLAEAIESVLFQSYSPFELIIVDDGSTDGSATIAQNYKEIRYIFQRNMGVSVARNTGLATAKGEFIAFLDADDVWHPQKLQIQIDYMQSNPSVKLTLSKINNFVESECNINPEKLQSIINNEQIHLASMVAHKTIFDKIGGFNPRYRIGEDLDWITRAKDAGIPMVILPEILLQRRIHNSNISFRQPQASITNRFQILKESIDRKRKKMGNNE
jgi:glycosyltransferase involved in cell wall biosynthesis